MSNCLFSAHLAAPGPFDGGVGTRKKRIFVTPDTEEGRRQFYYQNHESARNTPGQPLTRRRPLMRTLLVIAVAAIVSFTVWSTTATIAKQHGTLAIDPVGMMSTTNNLPTEQYDSF